MSEEMDDVKGGGVNAGGAVLGLGAAAGAAYGFDRSMANDAIRESISGEVKNAKIGDQLVKAVKKDGQLATHQSSLKQMHTATSAGATPKIDSITFKGKPGAYEMHTALAGGHSHVLPGVNLPNGQKIDAAITDQKVIKELTKDGTKSAVFKESEKSFVKGVRATNEIKMGAGLTGGFKNLNGWSKAKVIGGVVGAVGVGYMIGKKMFPSHADRVRRERQVQQDLGRA